MDIAHKIYYDTKKTFMVNKQIVVDNLLLSYTVFPQATGHSKHALLLFLHGWRSSKEIWQPLFPYLPHDVPQYFLDLPGFGASSTPPSAFTLDDYCAVVVGFIQKLGLPQLTLIGHSFGGRVAIKLAATQPELV